MLKADLHSHTSLDKDDFIDYSPKELIDSASKLGYEVLAITHHFEVYFTKEIQEYANKKGILLIPGAEARIENRDVLIYNATQEEIDSIKKLEDLKKIKSDSKLIIAPHPFYVYTDCLKSKLIEHIDLFDAIEYHFFYTKNFNFFNKKAEKIAKKYNKTMIGNTDTHNLWQLNYTYTLIDSEKNVESIIKAIKDNKVKIVTKPISITKFVRFIIFAFMNRFKKLFNRKPYK